MPGGSGARVTYPMGTCGTTSCFTNGGPAISNERFDLQANDCAAEADAGAE